MKCVITTKSIYEVQYIKGFVPRKNKYSAFQDDYDDTPSHFSGKLACTLCIIEDG